MTLAILFVLNLLNYVDRSVLYSMLPLIKDDWGLSDQALGWLGSGFLISYTFFSPVFGWLGDRYVRKWIAGAGVVVWSAGTAASAAAQNFTHLIGFRLTLGFGEASFSTTAPTIITDLYPRESRSKMLSIFYVAIPVGYALGFILGGHLGVSFGWRTAFLIVGLPGILMALAMFLVREPVRGQSEEISGENLSVYLEKKVPLKAYLELFRNRSYICNTAGMTLMTFVTGGLATWMPTYVYRTRGLSLEEAGWYFGIATFAAGIIGTFFGGWLADKLQVRWKSAYFLVSGIGLFLGIPFALIALFIDDPVIYWPAVFWAEFFLFINTGPSNAIIMNVTMPKMRVTAFAVNIFFIHALGDLISPVLIGRISDVTNLHLALLTVMPAGMILSGCAYLMGARHLVSDTQRVLDRLKSQ